MDYESLKILDIRLQEVGAKRRLNGTSKVNTHTNKQTNTHMDISTYKKHRPRGPMLWRRKNVFFLWTAKHSNRLNNKDTQPRNIVHPASPLTAQHWITGSGEANKVMLKNMSANCGATTSGAGRDSISKLVDLNWWGPLCAKMGFGSEAVVCFSRLLRKRSDPVLAITTCNGTQRF